MGDESQVQSIFQHLCSGQRLCRPFGGDQGPPGRRLSSRRMGLLRGLHGRPGRRSGQDNYPFHHRGSAFAHQGWLSSTQPYGQRRTGAGLGRVSLRPRRGRVFLFTKGQAIYSFQASHLAYQGPLAVYSENRRPVCDRRRVRGYASEKLDPSGLELGGFVSGLRMETVRKNLSEADELGVSWPDLGSIRLGGLELKEIELKPLPGGVLFRPSGQVRGPISREGWTRGGQALKSKE